jgi:hypothetical protein
MDISGSQPKVGANFVPTNDEAANELCHSVTINTQERLHTMYEQLDLMNLKYKEAELKRELRNDRLAEEAIKGNKRGKRLRSVGILSILAHSLHIR